MFYNLKICKTSAQSYHVIKRSVYYSINQNVPMYSTKTISMTAICLPLVINDGGVSFLQLHTITVLIGLKLLCKRKKARSDGTD